MSKINKKQMRNNGYYYPRRNEPSPYDSPDPGWGLRSGSTWPSDWAPRRTCQLCKKDFRTDNEEGFSSSLVDVCAPCIHALVKDQTKERKRLQEIDNTPFKSRMDEIHTQ